MNHEPCHMDHNKILKYSYMIVCNFSYLFFVFYVAKRYYNEINIGFDEWLAPVHHDLYL